MGNSGVVSRLPTWEAPVPSRQERRSLPTMYGQLVLLARGRSSPSLNTTTEHGGASLPTPTPRSSTTSLNGVAAISANTIWAVGTGGLVTVIEHWDGTQWTLVSSPNASSIDELIAVAALPGTNSLWAVGDSLYGNDDSNSHTLTQSYCEAVWSSAFLNQGQA
jgi:hypothetical protein